MKALDARRSARAPPQGGNLANYRRGFRTCRVSELTHSPFRLQSPSGGVLYMSHQAPLRLVAFLHGFRGGAVRTWREFPSSGSTDAWWEQGDLLFIGFDSVRETITGVASRLRRELPRLFPNPIDDQLADLGSAVREPPGPYEELVLVGHSLGGLILRRMLADCAQEWREQLTADPELPVPDLLRAQTRLFSPASAGFRSAGALGVLQASPGWVGLNMLLHRSSAFVDLQPGSPMLMATQARTEALVRAVPDDMAALRAQVVWANPDNVVNTERYETDYVDDSIDGTSHSKVCKPNAGYDAPRKFVREGRLA